MVAAIVAQISWTRWLFFLMLLVEAG